MGALMGAPSEEVTSVAKEGSFLGVDRSRAGFEGRGWAKMGCLEGTGLLVGATVAILDTGLGETGDRGTD